MGGVCIDLNLKDARAQRAVGNRLTKIVGINRELRDRLRKQIRLGFDKGESIDQIADRIQKTFKAQRARALTIARTETLASSSDGLDAQAQKTFGDRYDKVWVSARDSNVRETHAAIDGARVRSDERFANGLLRPHEPGASGEEVINCRCTLQIVPHSPK